MMLDIWINKRLQDFVLDVAFTSSAPLLALFGRSGSGKTTLINCLAGIATPDSGRIVINGHVLFDSEAGIKLLPEQRRIGYVFQDALLFPHLSVERNLFYGARHSSEASAIDAQQVIELLGIGHLLARRPATLSGGEKQRVAIGRALLSNPRVLLMDEPLASLDGERRHEILSYIESLRDRLRIPIVFVSHSVAEVSRLADEVILLSEGKVLASGATQDVMGRIDLFPHTGRHESGAIIETQVRSHDDAYELTVLDFDGGSLAMSRIDAHPGDPIRIRVRARDVALATSRPENISFANILQGRVEQLTDDAGAMMEVRLRVGSACLVARITRRSAHALALAPGKSVYAMIKAAAIDRRSIGQHG